MAGGGDQGNNKSNIVGSTSRPIPQRGPVIPVPTPGPRAPTPRSQPLPWPRLRMGLPGVSAFTPYVRNRVLTLDEEGSSGSSPASPPRQQEVTHSLRMGVPGVSAFTPYVRDDRATLTSPPTSPPPAQAQAQPQPHETAVASGSQIPGSSGGNEEKGESVRCSLCEKEFQTGKSLFGHMRSHPDRGWKGARPPPAFNAAEEFADLVPLIQPPPPVPDHPAHEEPAPPGDTSGGGVVAEEEKEEDGDQRLN